MTDVNISSIPGISREARTAAWAELEARLAASPTQCAMLTGGRVDGALCYVTAVAEAHIACIGEHLRWRRFCAAHVRSLEMGLHICAMCLEVGAENAIQALEVRWDA